MITKFNIRKIIALLCMVLACAYLISSCKPDPEVIKPAEEGPEPPETVLPEVRVTATVQGRVTYKGTPIGGATVTTAAGSAVTTDAEGNFTLQNVQLDPNAGFVKVEKEGYFTGSRTFLVTANSVQSVTISLIAKTIAGSFEAGAGGRAAFTRGSVTLPPGAVMKADSTPYSGTVSVAGYYIDPTSPQVEDEMPGDLRGITTGGQERGLQSFGMMAVELEGANGEKLQIAPGKTATLTFAIPASLQAEAPATIPLWYFDERKGLWQEQGTATRQGNIYTGTVSHFSYWNCDAPFEVVNLQAVLKDAAGQVLSGTPVSIRQVMDSLTRTARTDANGRISGKIPANQLLDLVVKTNACTDTYFTRRIGPFAADADLGEIVTTVHYSGLQQVVVTGKVEKCDGTPLTDGYVRIYTEGSYDQCASISSDGTYSFKARFCPQSGGVMDIVALDRTLEKNYTTAIVQVPANVSSFDAGTMRLDCGRDDGAILVTVGTETFSLIQWPDDVHVHSYVLDGQAQTKVGGAYGVVCENESRRLIFELVTSGTIDKVGTYPVLPSKIYIGEPFPSTLIYRYTFSGGELNVTGFDDVGGNYVITGNYTGKIMKAGAEVPLTYNFKSVRQR